MLAGRRRYASVAAGCMYLFKLGWELLYDDPQRLRRKLLIDEPIRFDTVVGLGCLSGCACSARCARRERSARWTWR